MKLKQLSLLSFGVLFLCSCSGINDEYITYYNSIKNDLLTNHAYYKYTISFFDEEENEIITNINYCNENEVFFSFNEDKPLLLSYDENSETTSFQTYDPSNKTYTKKDETYTFMLFFKFIFLEYLPCEAGMFTNKPIENVKGLNTYLSNVDGFLDLSSSSISNVQLKDNILELDNKPELDNLQTFTKIHHSMQKSKDGVITIHNKYYANNEIKNNNKLVFETIKQQEYESATSKINNYTKVEE